MLHNYGCNKTNLRSCYAPVVLKMIIFMAVHIIFTSVNIVLQAVISHTVHGLNG